MIDQREAQGTFMRTKWMLENNLLPVVSDFPIKAGEAITFHPIALVPDYLGAHYWWAYIHPKAVKLFERQWLVNLILWAITRGCAMLRSRKWVNRCPGQL